MADFVHIFCDKRGPGILSRCCPSLCIGIHEYTAADNLFMAMSLNISPGACHQVPGGLQVVLPFFSCIAAYDDDPATGHRREFSGLHPFFHTWQCMTMTPLRAPEGSSRVSTPLRMITYDSATLNIFAPLFSCHSKHIYTTFELLQHQYIYIYIYTPINT